MKTVDHILVNTTIDGVTYAAGTREVSVSDPVYEQMVRLGSCKEVTIRETLPQPEVQPVEEKIPQAEQKSISIFKRRRK